MPNPAADSEAQPFAEETGTGSPHLPTGSPGGPWRAIDRFAVVAFVLGLLAPALLLAAGLRPRSVENRPLRTIPALSVSGLLDATWPAGVDGFLTDNALLRQYAIRARGELYWLAGGTGNSQVIRGVGGWLFIRGEFEPDCQATGDQLGGALTNAASRFAATGQDFRFLLVPDKHTIYPDRVRPDSPFSPSCEDIGRAALSAAVGSLGPAAIDVAPLMAAARAVPNSTNLYYSKDSHWTPTGALVAIRAMVQSLDPGLWQDDDVVITGTRRRLTDLASLMGIRRVETTTEIRIRPGVTLVTKNVEVPVGVQNARSVFGVKATGDRPTLGGRTLILYDSFFGIYVPLVAPFFADSTWIHAGDMEKHPELATILGPFDRIVYERVERGLYGTDVAALLAPLVRTPSN